MKFTPKTEAQIREAGLIPAGTICDFEVMEAAAGTSKAGNAMITLKVKVWRPDGSTTLLNDWLISDALWKLLAFAKATGMVAEYEAGDMPPEALEGRTGRAKIGVQPATDDFPPKNRIAGYMPREGASAAPARAGGGARPGAAAGRDLDDDIPFGVEWRA